MKGKVIRGQGFRGVLNYVLGEEKEARILGGNMTGRNAMALAKEFSPVRQLRSDCEKPVLHIPLRLPEGEDVSDARWLEIALLFLKLMQLSANRPWVIAKHLNNHIHLITSRIDNNGKIWTGKWEGLRCIEATQQIERQFKLTITPGLKGANPQQPRLTSGQIKKISREVDRGQEPEIPAKVAIAERIQQAIDQSNGTFADVRTRLEKLGVAVKLNTAKTTDHVSGISFTFDKITIKGSKVARAYSWRGLQELLVNRKTTYENRRTPQPTVELGPWPDDRRATQPIAQSVGPELGSTRNRSPKGGNPTPSPVPSVVPRIGGGTADVVPDLLFSLLAKSPVAAGIAGDEVSIISAARKAQHSRSRLVENTEEDEGLGTDSPTIGF